MAIQETLSEALEDLQRVFGDQVHTGLPAQVRSYDAASQTATVRIMLTRPVSVDEDDESDVEQRVYPDIPRVRVCHLRWGSMAIAANLTQGDPCTLSFLEADPSAYLRTGERSAPEHVGRGKLAYAICWPALAPDPLALDPEHADGMVLGKDGDTPRIVLNSSGAVYVYSDDIRLGSKAASAAAAEAPSVEGEIQDLWDALNTHTHPAGTPNTGTPNGAPLGSAGSVGASKVTVE